MSLTPEDYAEMRELRERVAGFDADRAALEEQLREALAANRNLETALQGAHLEVQKLRQQRETAWATAMSRREDRTGDPEC